MATTDSGNGWKDEEDKQNSTFVNEIMHKKNNSNNSNGSRVDVDPMNDKVSVKNGHNTNTRSATISDTNSNKLDSDIENLQLLDNSSSSRISVTINNKGTCSDITSTTTNTNSSVVVFTNNSTTASSVAHLKNPTNHSNYQVATAITISACDVMSHQQHQQQQLHHHVISNHKFLSKTQSLDIVDERCNNLNEVDYSVSDEQLPARKLTAAGAIITNKTTTMPAQMQTMMPKVSSLDNNNHPPLFAQNRPIYANLPYSPYNSPFGSPRTGRRRAPLRESRRVSIDKTGSFLQLNQYKLMDQIGQGSYGLVKLAYSEEDSTHYAMKILSKKKLLKKAGLMGRGPKRGAATGTSPLDRVYREIAVLKKLDHPNVVKLVEVLDDPSEDSLYMVFELLTQGEVLSIPTDSPLSEERAWSVFRDTVLGVEYLHYQKIIHGDLKPANLLIDSCNRIKVADLGVCNEFLGEDASMQNGAGGTPAFRAPETLQTGQHSYNGKAADIWALGITLYALFFGKVPFVAATIPLLYEKIKSDDVKFPDEPTMSDDLRDFLQRILNKDPNERITLPQIKEHKWITKDGRYLLPSEEENCRLVQISDEDINSVVKSIPKLDTLILIKKMLKNHSFQNPFMASLNKSGGQGRESSESSAGTSGAIPKGPLASRISRLERFSRAGRSNSAPGDYNGSERQASNESVLPCVREAVMSDSTESSATDN